MEPLDAISVRYPFGYWALFNEAGEQLSNWLARNKCFIDQPLPPRKPVTATHIGWWAEGEFKGYIPLPGPMTLFHSGSEVGIRS